MRGLLLALLILAPASLGLAAADIPSGATPAAGPEDRETWVATIREARDTRAAARGHYQARLDAYQSMRHRRRLRGEKREALVRERDQAKAAVEEAERKLEALLESARRAGVPPGWVREAMEPEPADQGD